MNYEEERLNEVVKFIMETEKERERKFTYRVIAKEIGKSEQTIKWMKSKNPRLLELIKMGLMYEDIILEWENL